MTLPTLYKRTSKGATQQWDISVELEDAADGPAVIVTLYGQTGGAISRSEVVVAKGKNLGKANATTPHQQAQAEALAKWKKQQDKGYMPELNQEALASNMTHKPMLAQSYDKYGDAINFDQPTFIQPKLDGIRAIAVKTHGQVTLTSRGNKPIETVPHINAELVELMQDGEVWDGELYVHGEAFQSITSWVKKAQPNSAKVQYWVYDTIRELPFEFRYFGVFQRLDDAFSDVVVPVPTRTVGTHEEVRRRHDEYVLDGFEGAIVRHGEESYKEGYRSRNLLKVKTFDDNEFKILGVVQGKGKFEGLGIFTCVTDDGQVFEATPKGTEEIRRAYWTNREQHIGQKATVRHFGWTQDGIPRFPVAVCVRDYE
jgi:DNA ligase 1